MPDIIILNFSAVDALHRVNQGIYYGLIGIAICTSCVLIYKRLVGLNFHASRTRSFVVLVGLTSFPAGILSSRAANMFYYPVGDWGLRFFIDQTLYGQYHTYHAGLLLPVAVISVLLLAMRLPFRTTWDVIFLYLPLAHAIGRGACLWVGCCWGKRVQLNVWGQALEFVHPAPFYAIVLNLLIFILLRKAFNRIHSSPQKHPFRGAIAALYLILYGMVRFILELFRTETVVAWGLTQAQLVMVLFMVTGFSILTALAIDRQLPKRRPI